ncbi:diguanylate cyclase [Cupriavidus sp. 30B13]|uniref:GGDEF domain-containing protein n=1 Tax=Cupriavidus sp. 30B13 TaxID=3384241 RepID=UPI003B901550
MLSDESAAMMALLVLFTAVQCILAALMLALRRSAAGRAWVVGLALACAAGLLVANGRGAPAWLLLVAPALGLAAQLLIHRGIVLTGGSHAAAPGAGAAGAAAMLAVLGAAALGEGSRPAEAAGYAAAVAAAFTLAWLLPRPQAPGPRARPLVLAACALQLLAQCCGLYAVWGVSGAVAARHAEALLLLRLLPSFVAILAGLAAFTLMTMDAMLAAQERRARLDALTGLLNRGAIDSAARVLAAEYARHGHPMSCLVIDIDRFKRINDSGGHRAGDLVLRQIAAVVERTHRATDLAGRYGGEEFCVLCPHTGEADAVLLANRILHGIRAIALPPEMGGFASASIGIAEIRDGAGGGAAAWDRLFGSADRALYEAKRRGRGRVVSASSLEVRAPAPRPAPRVPARAEACH